MDLTIDGATIADEAAFHALIRDASGVDWYGGSLDALFDLLIAVVEPPITLTIVNAAAARAVIGGRFDRILTAILDAVEHRGVGRMTFRLEA